MMEIPTPREIVHSVVQNFPEEWIGDGFAPIFIEDNRVWLRWPDSPRIIRIEVVELPSDQWPRLPEL